MALVHCPECGNTVSDKAEYCPHCGNPLQKSNVIPPAYLDEEKIHGKNEGCFMQTLNLGCVGTVVLVLVVVIIFLIALVSV